MANEFNAKQGSVFKAYIAGCSNTSNRKGNKIIVSNTIKSSLTKLYPNPNKGIFTIDLGFENKNEIEVSIYNSTSKVVYKSTNKESVFKINLPNLPSGLYLVKLQGANYNETFKFIKE